MTKVDIACARLGFCLPEEEQKRIIADPPTDVDAFTDAVILAEGLDPALLEKHRLFSFSWPSVVYALDILAWDFFFPFIGILGYAVIFPLAAAMIGVLFWKADLSESEG